jgi:hypothetical protein
VFKICLDRRNGGGDDAGRVSGDRASYIVSFLRMVSRSAGWAAVAAIRVDRRDDGGGSGGLLGEKCDSGSGRSSRGLSN